MNRLWLLVLAGTLASWGAGRCVLSGVPQQIAAEGVAELAGPISLECSGATPAQVIQGAIAVSFSRRVANRRTGETLDGPVLELEAAPGFWMPFESRALLSTSNTVSFDSLRWTASSAGSFSLRIRGVRVEGAAETVQAAVQFYLSERLEVSSPIVNVARGTPALAAALMATLATRGPSPPDDADFAQMVRMGSPAAPVRVTEGFPSAFVEAAGAAAQGTRFLIRFAGVPEGVRMVLPDVVIGSSGMAPTRSGAFGRFPDTGLPSPFGGAQLLLLRVLDAEINGQGGRLAANPAALGPSMGVVRAAAFSRGTPYAVYEVVSADAARIESAEIPAWVAVPPAFDTPRGESIVRPTVVLAPLSENDGAHPTAPVPRYKPVTPAADCSLASDCDASWFPRMRLVEPSPLSFTAEAGGGIQIGNAGIRNDGGGLLEWRVSTRVRQGSSWLTVDPGSGVQNGGVRYDINPGQLEPGDYQGELVFEHIAPPNGRRDERVFALALKVTPKSANPPVTPPVTPPPPEVPAPVITGVTAGPARLSPPFAPGTLVIVAGTNFGEQPGVTVGGLLAQVVTVSAVELGVVLPERLDAGTAALVVQSGERSSAPWMVEIVPAAPILLFALNGDGERNAESAPAARGQPVDLYLTGLRVGVAVEVRLHDRVLTAAVEEGGMAGVRVVRITVPADLPAMQTTVSVTAQGAAQGAASHPLDLWIR